MRWLVYLVGAVAGTVGWAIGSLVGPMTAFILSGVATALGVYLARRWIAENL